MKKKIFKIIGIATLFGLIGLNAYFSISDVKSSSFNLKQLTTFSTALAQTEGGSCNNIEYTQTGRDSYITWSGQGALEFGISAGMKVKGISADILAKVSADIKCEDKDEYKVTCFDGGKACCRELDWHMCASSGCPKAGERRS
jgi:hypothetical protein